MKKNHKKMIAPIIIVICIVVYYIAFGIVLLNIDIPLIARIIGLTIPIVLAGAGIFVFIERIKEIRSGEEDDLSKY